MFLEDVLNGSVNGPAKNIVDDCEKKKKRNSIDHISRRQRHFPSPIAPTYTPLHSRTVQWEVRKVTASAIKSRETSAQTLETRCIVLVICSSPQAYTLVEAVRNKRNT